MMSTAVRMLMQTSLAQPRSIKSLGVAPLARHISFVSLISLGLFACDAGGGELQVELCGDVSIPQEIDSVRVSILDAKRQEVRAGVQELVDCGAGRAVPLPQRINFAAYDDAELWIVAQGLRQGVEVMRFERRYRPQQETQETPIPLGLTRACLGIFCPLGQTCVQGVCELAPFTSPASACKSSVPSGDADMGSPPDQGSPPEPPEMGQSSDMGSPPTPISTFCEQNQEQL